MSDDADDEPRTAIRFGTEPIARFLWADLQEIMKSGPLTFEAVAGALDKAMITHVAQRARDEKARMGQKPN